MYDPNGGGYKHFIHTVEYVSLFPIKLYQNYFREEIYANKCNLNTFSNFFQYIFDFYMYIKVISFSEERRICCQRLATSPEECLNVRHRK